LPRCTISSARRCRAICGIRLQAEEWKIEHEMGEPEDLIIDGAYMASRLARDVWRRYAPAPVENVVRLADVRGRIEVFLTALFETPIPVTPAEPAAPVSWLARIAGRAPDNETSVMAGTDGTRVYLPPALDASLGTEEALRTYLLLAVEQGVRISRGSAAAALAIESREIRDRFLLADAAAVDNWIARNVPGLVDTLRAARRDALSRRADGWMRTDRERAMEALVRSFLLSDPVTAAVAGPEHSSVHDVLARARRESSAESPSSYRGMPPVWYWGRLHASAAAPPSSALSIEHDGPARPPARRRVVEMRRRPRVREAEEGEDDSGTGTWVVRPDEPQETVEDPFGLQRPTDRADEADPEGLGDSLSELPEARVVRTPGQAKEVLRTGDDPPRGSGAAAPAKREAGTAYPEWDFRSCTYRLPGAIVREPAPVPGSSEWVASALIRHHGLVRRVRTRFERLRPRRSRVGRQADGPEVDIAEYVTAAADARAGGVVEDRLYVDVRPERRELTVVLLVDVSASTDSWVAGSERIIDVEKAALLVVCEALGALGDPYAIYAFSGESAEHVSVVPLKRFSDRTDDVVRRHIAALDADGYTRVGAAIRHATATLARQPTARKLLLLLSDGKPNDIDDYEGPYGIEDARQAVAEARAQNVDLFCLTVDREAPRYAPRIFGRAGFTLLRRPDQLPEVLIEVLRRLIRP
jgi:nitric oxide reductase NorD protein